MKTTIGEVRKLIRSTLVENPMGAGLVDPTNLTNAPYAYDYDALGMNAPNAPGKPYDYNSIRPEDPFEYLGFHVSKEDDENETSATPPSAAGDEDVNARGDEQPESADEIE